MLRVVAVFLVLMCGCSTYRGGGQSRSSVGRDTDTELAIYYTSGADESASFTQMIETITAAIVSVSAASTANSAIREIKR